MKYLVNWLDRDCSILAVGEHEADSLRGLLERLLEDVSWEEMGTEVVMLSMDLVLEE
jgi:hypothetical protein